MASEQIPGLLIAQRDPVDPLERRNRNPQFELLARRPSNTILSGSPVKPKIDLNGFAGGGPQPLSHLGGTAAASSTVLGA